MRGEDMQPIVFRVSLHGSPPHARGRRRAPNTTSLRGRITPACAGKTTRIPDMVAIAQDHPRMRGEDRGRLWNEAMTVGSPPHARGRPVKDHGIRLSGGITPACAGKTGQRPRHTSVWRDHPRMRGEDRSKTTAYVCLAGSPPHARGRQTQGIHKPPRTGITPACAGKTPVSRPRWRRRRDHPRMRGEDTASMISLLV